MIKHRSTYQRIVRRETHSAKSALAITLAAIVILALAYVAVECVLAFLQRPPLLVAPGEALAAAAELPAGVAASALLGAGALATLVGVVLVVAALTPGRRFDHVGETSRTALVVDNRAIASALARRASHAADLDPDRVVVSVSRRVAEVRVQPASGWPVNRDAIADAVADELSHLALTPTLRHRVIVSKQGVVGA
ncbi:DUF6286 domain-containing protein [Cryobacterium roopkundense]|uniref:DNA/RNA endonuclease G, NUC1 n=1 Tax=Cryobacterium roopkundense TaxID=1001240 RepID=A0A7W8ZYF1_9MICO|nr:DUF6286 domain-containing protein [Cryobacterium roopkundense]MBB5642466.1 hypothetical protein [Cryobacterium roopkundense]